jgi:hypothetical protein
MPRSVSSYSSALWAYCRGNGTIGAILIKYIINTERRGGQQRQIALRFQSFRFNYFAGFWIKLNCFGEIRVGAFRVPNLVFDYSAIEIGHKRYRIQAHRGVAIRQRAV